jgi:hypothetical protein
MIYDFRLKSVRSHDLLLHMYFNKFNVFLEIFETF